MDGDEPRCSVKRLFNAARLWLWFVRRGQMTSSLHAFLAYYRRNADAERDEKSF